MEPRGTDPLLEEVDEMRCAIMAEHGNDWRKVLAYHLEVDEKRRALEARVQLADDGAKSAA